MRVRVLLCSYVFGCLCCGADTESPMPKADARVIVFGLRLARCKRFDASSACLIVGRVIVFVRMRVLMLVCG